jgi:hypothetical protein
MEKELKGATGIITEDPSSEMPIGATLKFNPILVSHNFEHSSVWLKDWESFDGVLLSIHFANIETHSIEGSGVLVAPGIALCSKHVIIPNLEKIMTSQLGAIAMALSRSGVQIWRISKITLIGNSDLAIIGLTYASKLPDQNSFNVAIISTRLPKIGEKLLIGGFRASDYNFNVSVDDNNQRVMNCSGNVLCSTGIITNRFPTGRDLSMLPGPALEVGCPSFGGMSGGPVFDSQGMLVGLLSSSYDDGPSYVSLLWPALASEFEGGWPTQLFKGKTSLLNLTPSVCKIDRPEAIHKKPDGIVEYEIWEE